MIAQYLWQAGSLMIALMGLLHLRGTLFSKAMHPRDEQLIADMQATPLILTDKLTMWPSWIGFNATHSSGAIFLGMINCYIGYKYFGLLQSDPFFAVLTLLIIGFYAWVAGKYWFKTVFLLLAAAWLCFIVAAILMYM
ncbi:LIC_13387 family protein [Chitinophaga nivalis]|uniref:MAPEG family protein n=1 Tax=Chitinophaga nivalis TaxID=2991709 RepID=A0ABT3IK58_9BACT|nr:hypothetical protein [Chitinophaga nivalis]MCW3466114.1 hypothetical protein [Chitinophaga nivalis]MCW3484195.1 hypothetical protein [Chitinophaga nivalis]